MTVKHEPRKSWTEKKSMENLVRMYREELLRVVKGEHCSNLIPQGVRKRMKRDGILQKSGNHYSLTSLGKNMLGVEASAARAQTRKEEK